MKGCQSEDLKKVRGVRTHPACPRTSEWWEGSEAAREGQEMRAEGSWGECG